MDKPYFVHESAYVDEPCEIGDDTKIWHFSHVMPKCKIGRKCILGQNVHVATGVIIGDNVKIQNNVSLYDGAVIEDDVFLGPSCVLTNVSNPRSQIVRRSMYERTLIRRGASVGANATIVCGITIGRYAFIAAGAVVTKNMPDYALVGSSGKVVNGWPPRIPAGSAGCQGDHARHETVGRTNWKTASSAASTSARTSRWRYSGKTPPPPRFSRY